MNSVNKESLFIKITSIVTGILKFRINIQNGGLKMKNKIICLVATLLGIGTMLPNHVYANEEIPELIVSRFEYENNNKIYRIGSYDLETKEIQDISKISVSSSDELAHKNTILNYSSDFSKALITKEVTNEDSFVVNNKETYVIDNEGNETSITTDLFNPLLKWEEDEFGDKVAKNSEWKFMILDDIIYGKYVGYLEDGSEEIVLASVPVNKLDKSNLKILISSIDKIENIDEENLAMIEINYVSLSPKDLISKDGIMLSNQSSLMVKDIFNEEEHPIVKDISRVDTNIMGPMIDSSKTKVLIPVKDETDKYGQTLELFESPLEGGKLESLGKYDFPDTFANDYDVIQWNIN